MCCLEIFVDLSLIFVALQFLICRAQPFKNTLFERPFPTNTNFRQAPGCIHDVPTTPISLGDSNEFVDCFEEVKSSRMKGNPDVNKRTNEIILSYGYDLMTYDNVTTKDGYILTLFRVPGGKTSPPTKGKPVVLLFHGLGTASDQWVLQCGDKNLVFKLVDAGYEVWLANARGTDYSQGHVKLTTNDIEYWDFSFHEIGIYDLPAILDVILTETGIEKIFFVGHSMGAAVYAVALSEMSDLNEKIQASLLLAPAIFIGHLYSPHRVLSPILEFGPQIQSFINILLRGHIPRETPGPLSLSNFCTPTAMRCGVCENLMFYLYGYDAPQIDFANIPNILSKISNTYSFKTVLHFGQNFRSCMFRRFDYGQPENLSKYGQPQPPSYNISKITTPIYIYYGDADNFVPPVDIAITRDALPRGIVKGFFRVQWKLFNHIDFMIAKDADTLVYNSMLKIMQNYK